MRLLFNLFHWQIENWLSIINQDISPLFNSFFPKNYWYSYEIDNPILIMSLPWSFFGFNFFIVSPMRSEKNLNDSKSDLVWAIKIDLSLLIFMKGLNCFANIYQRDHISLQLQIQLCPFGKSEVYMMFQ